MAKHRLKAYVYLLFVAAIWGAAGPIIKFTLGGISPLPFIAYRFAISAVFSLIYIAFFGLNLPKPTKNLPLVAIYGLLAFTIGLGALFWGLDKTTVLDMTVISLIGPLMVVAGGAMVFKDHVTRQEKVGIALVLAGAIFMTVFPAISEGTEFTGNLILLIFLLADTAATLLAKKMVRRDVPTITLTNLGFIIGALTTVPLALVTIGPTNFINQVTNLSLNYHLGVWYMALISGTLAYFLWVGGNKSIEVSEATLFRYLQPLIGVPLAIVWLGEKITGHFIVGAILVIAGIIIAEHKKKRYNRPT